ncbi:MULTISPECIES: hypothetical protein [Microbacterium]|nr:MULTISPECIES: hypothetical protein [Microbacterium]
MRTMDPTATDTQPIDISALLRQEADGAAPPPADARHDQPGRPR